MSWSSLVHIDGTLNSTQGLINLPSGRKHKANLGAPHIYLPKLDGAGGGEILHYIIEKTYNIFLFLNVTFYTYKYYRNYNAERFF